LLEPVAPAELDVALVLGTSFPEEEDVFRGDAEFASLASISELSESASGRPPALAEIAHTDVANINDAAVIMKRVLPIISEPLSSDFTIKNNKT